MVKEEDTKSEEQQDEQQDEQQEEPQEERIIPKQELLGKLIRDWSIDYRYFNMQGTMLSSLCHAYKLTTRQFYILFLLVTGHNSVDKIDLVVSKHGKTVRFGEEKCTLDRPNIWSIVQNLQTKCLIDAATYNNILVKEGSYELMFEILNQFIKNLQEWIDLNKESECWSDTLTRLPAILDFSNSNNIFLTVADLPIQLYESLITDAEKAYAEILQSSFRALIATGILQTRLSQKNLNSLSSAPIFIKYTEDLRERFSSDKYYGNGASIVSGWVTSFSSNKTLNFGQIYNCIHNHYLLSFSEQKVCPTCHTALKEITPIQVPVYEITIETSEGTIINAYIHADLWNPGESVAIKQNLLLFKLKNEFIQSKSAKDDMYYVLAIEKDEKLELNEKSAKEIAARPTRDILNVFESSLYADTTDIPDIEDAALVSMASIGTEEILVRANSFEKKLKGTINMLVYGYEGTGKSQVCKIINGLVSVRKNAATGFAGSSSVKGLTASFDKDLNAIKAGVIPMNDTFSVLVEELDKFKREDTAEFLQPAEEKIITYNKGGKQAVFSANTVLYFTANPKKTDIGSDAMDQMKTEMLRPLIDRMDIVCAICQKVNALRVTETWINRHTSETIDKEKIRNYYLNLREIKSVVFDENCISHVHTVLKNHAELVLTPRRLNSLIKIASAIAKMHLRAEVNEQDIDEAYDYFIEFLKTIGEIHPDTIIMMESADVATVIAERTKDYLNDKSDISVEELMTLFKKEREIIISSLKKLKDEGLIYSIDGEVWKKCQKDKEEQSPLD